MTLFSTWFTSIWNRASIGTQKKIVLGNVIPPLSLSFPVY